MSEARDRAVRLFGSAVSVATYAEGDVIDAILDAAEERWLQYEAKRDPDTATWRMKHGPEVRVVGMPTRREIEKLADTINGIYCKEIPSVTKITNIIEGLIEKVRTTALDDELRKLIEKRMPSRTEMPYFKMHGHGQISEACAKTMRWVYNRLLGEPEG